MILAGLIAVAVVVVIVAQAQQQRQFFGKRGRGAPDAPVPVLAAQAKLADVPVYLDGVGTTKALNTVTVRPQVDGKLMRILFQEGQDVQSGQVLFIIDSRPYVAAVNQARDEYAAQLVAALRVMRRQAPHEFKAHPERATTLKLGDELFRTCVPGPDPKRWFCVLVRTDSQPPGVKIDDNRESNESLNRPGGGF